MFINAYNVPAYGCFYLLRHRFIPPEGSWICYFGVGKKPDNRRGFEACHRNIIRSLSQHPAVNDNTLLALELRSHGMHSQNKAHWPTNTMGTENTRLLT